MTKKKTADKPVPEVAAKNDITTRIVKAEKRDSYWRGGVQHTREWQTFNNLSDDAIARIKADSIIEIQ